MFISQDQLQSCAQSFNPQQGVSLNSCGFQSLYLGSSKCSNLVLQDVRKLQQYQDALDKCSHFDHPFGESCADCTGAILSLRDGLHNQVANNNNNHTELAICEVAAIVAVAAGKPNDPVVDKVLRCLPPSASGSDKSSHLHHFYFFIFFQVLNIWSQIKLTKSC